MCKKLVYLTSFVLVLFLASNAFSAEDPSDMADSSGDIKRIEAWVEDGNLNLTMTVYGVFAPAVEDTPAGMSNRYYYHWLLDTDADPATGFNNSEYEGNPTNLETPIGADLVVQFGWRDGNTNGVNAYDPLTEVTLFEDYEYTIDGDTIHAVIPLEDLGLDPAQTIALSAFQEGASNDWQVDWIESFELTLTAIEKTVLFAEDFEGLELGPNVDETLAGDAVWTDTPPEGWIVDESGIPGLGMDETDGVTEWAGWAFADKAWWIEAAEDQDRSLFELASGTVAVADPDEWDDDERLPIPIAVDPYDTWLTTPDIKIGSAEAGTLELKFDSSWRPEFDDNLHQTANITASFDGGDPVVVMLWESDEASDYYKPYATNETVVVKLDNPTDAKKLVLTFGLFDAGNDWWWAIDNIEVSGVVPDMGPVNPGTVGLVAFYALDGDATDSSGNGIDGVISNADTGGLGLDGSVWVDDPERGTVISFNGTAEGAFVRAGEIPQMTLTNDFTWSFWANHSEENTADNDIIFGNRMDETPADFAPRQFIKFTPTKFEWHMNGNGDDNLDYDDIPADIWLHHTVVKTADQLTYYRNGVEHSSGVFTQPLDFPQPLFFGGDNEGSAGENWSGLMSDVAIYDRALSEAEIRYLAGERAAPTDVTAPGDVVKGVPDEARDGSAAGWPDGEYPGLAVDDDVSTKFLHFRGEVSPTGFVVEPASGASVVTGLSFTTANDAPERDPISFELSGSNGSIDGPYELIASGDIVDFAQADAWPRFTMNATPISFDNDVAYKYYQVMFPAVRDAANANSMQIAEIELLGTGPFTAYNDCVYDADQDGTGTDPTGQAVHYIAPNVTTFGVGSGFSGSSSGELLDQKTGNPTGVIATLTESGGVVWQPQNSGSFTGGYDTAVGTDAYDTFNGIADMTGVIYYGSTGWYVDLTLTGLNPNRTYTFATSASRSRRFTDGGGDGYADRNSIYTISGVDAATNASTLGTEQYLDDPLSVWFNTGNNHDEGYVARWTDINPGPDGSFTVRAEAHPDSNDGGRKAYTFDVFMLQELAN